MAICEYEPESIDVTEVGGELGRYAVARMVRVTSTDASYICPECGKPGLPSALDGDCCTNCANRRRGV